MSEIKVLIIGETKETKYKIWNYYKKILKINQEAQVYCWDLRDSDFNYDWNEIVELYPTSNTDNLEYEILDKEIIEHYNIIDFRTIPRFDVIIANNVLERIYNLRIFLSNVVYHLKENGRFVILTVNSLYLPYNELIKSKKHYIFVKNHLVNLLKKFGFKIEKVEYGVYKFGIKKFIPYLFPKILIISKK
jgi:2-polyprenyl-3-methyl-5-hydroxy-6-metoxy-1,4-benzoquinol methylase